jgi:hypothetical protein
MNLRKALSLAAAVSFAAGAATVSIAGDDAPVFALSSGDAGKGLRAAAANTYMIDFVPGGKAVAGVNFDVIIEGEFNKRSDGGVTITDCAGAVSGTHVSRCEMVSPNRLRVLVFSAPTSELPAATLVSFSVNGTVKEVRIDAQSTAVSDLNGGMIQAEVL